MKFKCILFAMLATVTTAAAQDSEIVTLEETGTVQDETVVLQDDEEEDKNIFNHMSIGLNVGTPGIGIDVAMPICNYVQVRAGVSFVPNIKFDIDLDITRPTSRATISPTR